MQLETCDTLRTGASGYLPVLALRQGMTLGCGRGAGSRRQVFWSSTVMSRLAFAGGGVEVANLSRCAAARARGGGRIESWASRRCMACSSTPRVAPRPRRGLSGPGFPAGSAARAEPRDRRDRLLRGIRAAAGDTRHRLRIAEVLEGRPRARPGGRSRFGAASIPSRKGSVHRALCRRRKPERLPQAPEMAWLPATGKSLSDAMTDMIRQIACDDDRSDADRGAGACFNEAAAVATWSRFPQGAAVGQDIRLRQQLV